MHKNAIQNKADQPDDQICDMKRNLERIGFLQDKIIGDLHGDHRCKDRSDQIQEICDVVHRINDRCDGSDHGYDDGSPFLRNLFGNGYAGNACGIRIKECGCNR